MYEVVPLIYSGDFRFLPGIENWCRNNGIHPRYDDSVPYIHNDGNPLWQWLLEQGIADNSKEGMRIAIIAA